MPLSDLYRLSLVGRLHGQRTINTFYYQWFAGGAGLDETAASLSLRNGWIIAVDPVLLTVMSNQWSRTELLTTNVSVFPTIALGGPTVEAAGLVVSKSEPSEVAVVLSRRTTLGGRAGRGRVYLPGVPDLWVTDSKIDPSRTDDYDGLRGSLSVPFTNNTITWQPRHAVRSTLNPKTWIPISISEWRLDPILRAQRRRQLGVGQ